MDELVLLVIKGSKDVARHWVVVSSVLVVKVVSVALELPKAHDVDAEHLADHVERIERIRVGRHPVDRPGILKEVLGGAFEEVVDELAEGPVVAVLVEVQRLGRRAVEEGLGIGLPLVRLEDVGVVLLRQLVRLLPAQVLDFLAQSGDVGAHVGPLLPQHLAVRLACKHHEALLQHVRQPRGAAHAQERLLRVRVVLEGVVDQVLAHSNLLVVIGRPWVKDALGQALPHPRVAVARRLVLLVERAPRLGVRARGRLGLLGRANGTEDGRQFVLPQQVGQGVGVVAGHRAWRPRGGLAPVAAL